MELMDPYWDLKQQDLRVRLGRPVQWTGVIDALLECMDDKQILSAPLAVVDVVGDDARAMVSEHVLMQEGQRYSFFHESFFDYAFARRFAGRNRPLIEYLKAREQHLFRRAQLRQILVYERQADRPSYLSDLALLLNDSGVRFHLKQVAVALLGTFSDPSEDEFSVLAQFILVSANPLSKDIWLLLQNSVPWFRIADAAGLIESWLCGTDELADRAVMVLTGVQAKEPDRVAHLLDAYSAGVGRWRERLLWMIPRTNPAASPVVFHLLLRLLDSGTLDGLDFLSYLYQWPEHQLDLAAEAVARWASRRVDIGQAAGEMNPFRVGGRPEGNDFGGDRLTQIAMHAPGAFVRHVLPVLEQIAVSNLTGRGAPPRPDRVWLYRERGLPYTVEGAFLQAAELALTSLLQSDPTQFSIEAARLQNSDSATLQFLLIRAYAAVAESGLADDALRYLSGDQRRLSLGYASDLHRPARDLIVTASTLGSADVLAELEHVLLDYYSASETSEGGRASVGYVQYRLLSAIDQTRLSEAARQRVEQWTSKFGQLSPELAEDDGAGGFVGSPIAEQEAAGLTDMQWIEAVGTYCDDSLRSVDDAGKVLGGMYEAAETLAAQAKIQPARFAALALEFPRGTHTAYYGALLRSLRDAPMTVDQVLGLVRLTHGLPDRPLCQPLCDFIGGHAELELPDEVWGAVLWYAQQPPHQEEDEWLTDGTADAPIGDRPQE